jgi:peptidoglycan hydrolase FlgJ
MIGGVAPPTALLGSGSAASGESDAKAKLSEAAQAFEAVILRQMLAAARQAKLADDVFGSGASDNFREMADARLADSLAALKQFGIASLLEQQLGRVDGAHK